jgi:hypothetical protein
MTDPRNNPLFWEIRARLEQSLGGKVPLGKLVTVVREIGSDHQIRVPRSATRKKDKAIEWICDNLTVSEPFLSPTFSDAVEQSVEARVQRNWPMIPRVRAWLLAKFGHPPKMAEIIATATGLAELFNLRIDRQAKRSKAAMECWFAEHWELIECVPQENLGAPAQVEELERRRSSSPEIDFMGFDRLFEDL